MTKLLVVDDEPDKQRKDILVAAVFAGIDPRDTDTPDSWDDAEATLTQSFQIAVIDIDLWSKLEGGIELIRRLHASQPECNIIALTKTRSDIGERAMEAGARLFIYTKWDYIPWTMLLEEQLKLYKGYAERAARSKQPVNA